MFYTYHQVKLRLALIQLHLLLGLFLRESGWEYGKTKVTLSGQQNEMGFSLYLEPELSLEVFISIIQQQA